EQARRGEQLYDKKCSSCHGTNLMGGLHAPSLVGSAFTPNWNDMNLYDLFDKMRTSMPEDDPGSLSSRQTADIVAFMLQKGEYPAGTSELPTEADALQTYKFFALRPGAKQGWKRLYLGGPMRVVRLCVIACVALLMEVPLDAQQGARRGEWTVLGGDKAYTKYTPLDQINKENVATLRIAWRRPSLAHEFLTEYPE